MDVQSRSVSDGITFVMLNGDAWRWLDLSRKVWLPSRMRRNNFPTSPKSALTSPMSTQPSHRPGHRRVCAFAPVPLRRRRAGGWTPMKQAAFLAALALTGSVRKAARRVGMSRETAYRLRAKPGGESFADSWDRLTGRWQGRARKVTPAGLKARFAGVLLKPLIYRGRHCGTAEKYDVSALLRYDAQFARSERGPRQRGSEPGLSYPELRQRVLAG
jgi:hypothetical protein